MTRRWGFQTAGHFLKEALDFVRVLLQKQLELPLAGVREAGARVEEQELRQAHPQRLGQLLQSVQRGAFRAALQ